MLRIKDASNLHLSSFYSIPMLARILRMIASDERTFMKQRFLLSSAVVFLSLLLVYSGVVWAFEECFRGSDTVISEQFASVNLENPNLAKGVVRSTVEHLGVLHCVPVSRTFDVIAQILPITSFEHFLGLAPLMSRLLERPTSPGGFGSFGGHLLGGGGFVPLASSHVS